MKLRAACTTPSSEMKARLLPPPSRAQVYELTQRGYHAEPAIQELGRWAAMFSRHDPTLPLSPVSLMLSFRTMLDRQRACEVRADIGFDVEGQTFRARLSEGAMPIVREDVEGAQAIFRAPSAAPVAAHFYGKLPVEQISGLELSGDVELAAHFVDLFHLPPRIG